MTNSKGLFRILGFLHRNSKKYRYHVDMLKIKNIILVANWWQNIEKLEIYGIIHT
jgi:Uri superfamily endonuclease